MIQCILEWHGINYFNKIKVMPFIYPPLFRTQIYSVEQRSKTSNDLNKIIITLLFQILGAGSLGVEQWL